MRILRIELAATAEEKQEKRRPRKFIEDDDVPDLADDDDSDSDDETQDNHRETYWKNAHTIAETTASAMNKSESSSESYSGRKRSINMSTPLEKLQQTMPQDTFDNHTVLQAKSDSSIQNLWHQRLGHPNNRHLRDMANNPLYLSRGFPALTSKQLDMRPVCDAYMTGKSHTITSHKIIDKDATKKGQSWSVDLTGRKDTAAIGDGANIGVVFIEHSTRFSVTYTIKTTTRTAF